VYDERVKLVEQLMIVGEGRLKHLADFAVSELGMSMAVTFQDSARVGVDYEYRMFTGVEKNGVGGFRADATKGEKLCAKGVRGSREQARKGASI
jgi:hypothetical protein